MLINTYKKDELTFDGKNIYLSEDAMMVTMPSNIVMGFNHLEYHYQIALHAKKNMRNLKPISEFEFESAHKGIDIKKPDTPTLDEQVEISLKIIEETEKTDVYERVKEIANQYEMQYGLVSWIKQDYVFNTASYDAEEFDLKKIGNPLKMTEKKFIKIIKTIAKYVGD